MDTHGHRELSAIGEQLLKPALKKSNSNKDLRIAAFYFGNWLTDVSQSVDPVAYRSAMTSVDAIEQRIHGLFDRMRFDAPSWLPSVLHDVTDPLRHLRESLMRAEKELVGHVRTALLAGRDGEIAKALKDAFRFVGYYKFVLDEHGQPTEMDEAVYLKLFDERFSQYFPHEHLDRPAVKPGGFAAAKARGPLNTRTRTEGAKDLYEFLRADIELVAGLLSYLDSGNSRAKCHQSWASATFHMTRTKFIGRDGKLHDVDDKSYEWNYHLAMLGHALHGAEDFFSHSTFVEHASSAFPDEYDRAQRYEESEVLARRLKQWGPSVIDDPDSWTSLPADSHVVTGYFDFRDTAVSLSHVLEDLLHRPTEKAGKKLDGVLQYDYQKLLADTLELATDFDKVWHDPRNDPKTKGYDDREGNLAVKALREKGGEGLEALEGKSKLDKIVGALNEGPNAALPSAIKDSFGSSVKLFGAVKLGVSLYKALKSIHEFVSAPLSWLKKFLPTMVIDLLKEFGEVYLTNLIADWIGAKRIGCHSLIAKDTGPELLNKASNECARAVDWYIVRTLTRHARRPVVDAARCDASGRNRNTVYLVEHLDWLELCEHFLCHPFARIVSQTVEMEVSVPIVHVTRRDSSGMSPDSLASLANEYRSTFRPVDGGPEEFTWEVIADANFPTRKMSTAQRQRAVNRVLREQGTGRVVSDKVNMAFKPDLRVIIPYQATTLSVQKGKDMGKLWWYPVILGKDGYRCVARWFNESGGLAPDAPIHAHRPFPIEKSESDAFFERVLAKQNTLRREYEGDALEELY